MYICVKSTIMNKTCFILLYLLIGLFTMSIKAQQTGSDSAFVLMDTIITYDSETMTEEIKVVKNLVYYQVDTIPIFRLCELDPKPLECSKNIYWIACTISFNIPIPPRKVKYKAWFMLLLLWTNKVKEFFQKLPGV